MLRTEDKRARRYLHRRVPPMVVLSLFFAARASAQAEPPEPCKNEGSDCTTPTGDGLGVRSEGQTGEPTPAANTRQSKVAPPAMERPLPDGTPRRSRAFVGVILGLGFPEPFTADD